MELVIWLLIGIGYVSGGLFMGYLLGFWRGHNCSVCRGKK